MCSSLRRRAAASGYPRLVRVWARCVLSGTLALSACAVSHVRNEDAGTDAPAVRIEDSGTDAPVPCGAALSVRFANSCGPSFHARRLEAVVCNAGPASAPAGQPVSFTATASAFVLCDARTEASIAAGACEPVRCDLAEEIGVLLGWDAPVRVSVGPGPSSECGVISGSTEDSRVWLHCE